uniref:AlNc14C19G2031 protein n=1 Tax=Albugo laibachii Nc14 TaxID=890382 RepID=F0W560_9STRA|nr:AlNc14C19G2031 [Albugo laibachii Nc14]|eukprot:CCA16251.1 AlNc14C19G2031 [Albugo laibachii Nc14]
MVFHPILKCVLASLCAAYGIPLIANLIGFGAGGISGGSLAASGMSCAAKSAGGGIASGSIIAYLQSIGAIGFAKWKVGCFVLMGGATAFISTTFSSARIDSPRRV